MVNSVASKPHLHSALTIRLNNNKYHTISFHSTFTRTMLWIILFLSAAMGSSAMAEDKNISELISQLNSKNFSQKTEAVRQLAISDHSQVRPVLEAFLDGKLFYVKKTRQVVIVKKIRGGYEIFAADSGDSLGEVKKSEVRKIGVNNRLRTEIRGHIARLQFNSPDANVRLAAVRQIAGSIDDTAVEQLKVVRENEASRKVIAAIDAALAVHELGMEDPQQKLRAIKQLAGNLDPVVRTALNGLVKNDKTSSDVKEAARLALLKIDDRVKFFHFLETVFFGLSLGSILVLAAIGLAITFGVMGVINMAHGELMMLGAYTTYVIQTSFPQLIEYSLLMAIPAAFLVAALTGIVIERGIIRHLYGRPLETLLATFGVSLILQQAVRTIFSPLNRSVITPQWMSGSLEINSVLSLTYNRLFIVIFSLLVFLMLVAIMRYTRLGLEVRAVSQNRSMAKAMGVRSEWVDAMTFGLGSGIAGVAGVALSQLTNVGPNLGQAYIVDSFMVVVFGGVGNIWGTMISGLSLGVVNKFVEPYAGAVMAKILILIFIILFIQKRPRGLFPQKGRAAEG